MDKVRDHEEAVSRLQSGELRGVIGHTVFIESCWKAIRLAQQGDGNEFLRALRQTPEDVFNDVSVDMFVNSRLSPFAARRALSLIHKSVEYLKNKPDAKEVNDVLGLEETDARAGTQIPGVYEYEVGSFGTEAIMTFCRERLEEGTDSVN